jgi:hypothetical protein
MVPFSPVTSLGCCFAILFPLLGIGIKMMEGKEKGAGFSVAAYDLL